MLGSKIRVCQMLILPPYQGLGLGRYCLLEVYRLAAERMSIVEVTVEDPCEGFQRLRDAVDVEWALCKSADCLRIRNCGFNEDVDVEELSKILKIIPLQVQFVLNTLFVLNLLNKSTCVGDKRSLNNESVDEKKLELEMKTFRLKVKKQLLNSNRDLKGLSKKDMQYELNVLYEEYFRRIQRCHNKAFIWH